MTKVVAPTWEDNSTNTKRTQPMRKKMRKAMWKEHNQEEKNTTNAREVVQKKQHKKNTNQGKKNTIRKNRAQALFIYFFL